VTPRRYGVAIITIRRYFRGDGYGEADRRTLGFGDHTGDASDSPSEHGSRIAAALESVHDDRGRPVDVVAHSVGGLGARRALEELDAAPYARELVTLGTPHRGTRAAHLAKRTPGGREWCPAASSSRR
jgi:triacylglycerol esterase/lipase EstA (alpha/beta hydrolase family)